MSCPNCQCSRCKSEREAEQTERFRRWDAHPSCPICNGSGKIEDVCGYHVAMVTCSDCGGTGKRGMGRR